jgi:aryl-alcohol dehydrogenase-like predicted oxidoreductase
MARSDRPKLSRREALRLGALAGAGIVLWRPAPGAAGTAAESPVLARPIPSTGEKLPVVGLGTNSYGVTEAADLAARKEVLKRLGEIGGSVIDTAPAYGSSEIVLGDLMAELRNRDRFFLATKVTSRTDDGKDGAEMMEESFRRLKTKRVDLMQVHNLEGVDALMPILEAWKKEGRIRYLGITTSRNEAHGRMIELMKRHPLDFVQVNYSLGNRGAAESVLPLAQEKKIAVLVNMPLGGRRSENLLAKVADRELPAWAGEIDARSWAQLFLKYCISHPAVTCVIPGTSKVRHLEDNLAAARGRVPDAEARRRMEGYWDSRESG